MSQMREPIFHQRLFIPIRLYHIVQVYYSGTVDLNIHYTDIFRLVNLCRTKSRNFRYDHPIEVNSQKISVYFPIVGRNFQR
jgi:hypothetical protein